MLATPEHTSLNQAFPRKCFARCSVVPLFVWVKSLLRKDPQLLSDRGATTHFQPSPAHPFSETPLSALPVPRPTQLGRIFSGLQLPCLGASLFAGCCFVGHWSGNGD
ncbi:hypothetical protein MHYP_G00060250 [Metynnis hypsauchen]